MVAQMATQREQMLSEIRGNGIAFFPATVNSGGDDWEARMSTFDAGKLAMPAGLQDTVDYMIAAVRDDAVPLPTIGQVIEVTMPNDTTVLRLRVLSNQFDSANLMVRIFVGREFEARR